MTTPQHTMIVRSTEAIRDSSKKFREHLAVETFRYDQAAYQPFFEKLDAALAYVEGLSEFEKDDATLQAHMETLRQSATELLKLLQAEANKHLAQQDTEPADFIQKWDMEIHDMKNHLNVIGGHMELVYSSIGIIMYGSRKNMPDPGIPV